jgi:hypothetical protein
MGRRAPADIMYAGTSPCHGSKDISVFHFDRDNAHVSELQIVTGKKIPGSLAGPNKRIKRILKREYVFINNMRPDNIVYFKRDAANGTLMCAGQDHVPSVACVIQL